MVGNPRTHEQGYMKSTLIGKGNERNWRLAGWQNFEEVEVTSKGEVVTSAEEDQGKISSM